MDLTRLMLGWHRLRRRPPPVAGPSRGVIVIGEAEDGAPVTWPSPEASAASHVLVAASSGAGKTVMVAAAIAAEFIAGLTSPATEQPSYLVVDPKGDLAEHVVAAVAALDPAALARVTILNPFTTSAFPFNLAHLPMETVEPDVRAQQLAGLVAELSTAAGALKHLSVGARQMDVLVHTILASLTARHPGRSLLLALDALTVPSGAKRLAELTASARARQFLLTAKLSDELKASCASRLRSAIAASDALARLVGAPGCISFAELLRPGSLTVLHVGSPPAGLMSASVFYANAVLRLAADHLGERETPWRGHHVRLVVDEVQIVAPALAEVAEHLYSTGRSRGISLVVMTQGTTLIHKASTTLLQTMMTNTPTKIVGRLGVPDAQLLAKEIAPERGVKTSLSALRGRMTALMSTAEDRAFLAIAPSGRVRFTSANVDMAGWSAAAERHQGRISAAVERHELRAGQPLRLGGAGQPRVRGRGRNAPAPQLALVPPSSTDKPPSTPWG